MSKTLDLSQFTGSENYYRHPIVRHLRYTDGVRYVANEAKAYQLINTIASYQVEAKVRSMEFQHWILEVNEDHSAVLRLEDGNYNEILTQKIAYTDFPLPEIHFYLVDNVLMLNREY